ncbi:TadE family type IV pilus minor pilin [Paramicrobacterium agarici]|uniref:TadE family type IV pilus minor pilin n=1 Tax=Paramicrobacterium agarici TaxID=630514 RepID=UPI001FE673E0|nr:TadE family type IV pilus minor pilin [Microbacterium agarici]
MRSRSTDNEHGSVTAELAVVIPAVMLVLALCMWGLQVTALQVRVTDAAADAARTLARGDSMSVARSRVTTLVGGAQVTSAPSGDFVCATVSARAAVLPIDVSARSCALAGGL